MKKHKSSIDYYIKPNRILCSAIGMWPLDDGSSTSSKLFAYFRLLFALTAIGNIFVPGIMLIAVNWGDLEILTGVGCVSMTLAQFVFKTLYLVVRRERACKLYQELRDLWDSSDNPKERECYEEFAYWARTGTIVWYSSAMCTVVSFTVAAAFHYIKAEHVNSGTDNGRHLPFDVWYGKDITASPGFEIAFLCQVTAAVFAAVGVCGLDSTCMTMILHLSGQFKLISVWVCNIQLEKHYKQTDRCEDCPLNFDAYLIKCIRHHQRLISTVNDVNNLLTPIIFVQLLTSGIEICLSGFAVMCNGSNSDLYKFISYLTSMIIQLTLLCWPGEILVQESQEIGHTVYSNVPWYRLSPYYRRQLLQIIVRSQQYCSISAITFQKLSINTLTTVFNTATSYFTLLRQMQQK